MTPVLAQPQLSLVPPGAMDIELNSSSPSDQEITKDRFSEFAPTPAVETLANLTELSYVPSNDPDATQASLFPAITPEGEPTPINTADNWLQAENIPITSTQENSVSLAPSASVLLPAKTDYRFGDIVVFSEKLDSQLYFQAQTVNNLQAQNVALPPPASNSPLQGNLNSSALLLARTNYRFGDIVVFSEKLDSQLSLQDLQAPTLQAQNIDNLQAQTVDPPSSAGDPSLQANRPRFSQPLADLAPSGNPSMGFNARPISDQINVDELITLAEEDKTAQITLPRYVPRVPLDAPTPPEPDLPEPPTSPLPPNVPKEVGQKILDIIIEGLLDHGASKYPFIINTSDLLTINPTSFRPSQFNTYFNFSLDLDDFDRFNPMTEDAFSDPVWKDFTTSVYPSDQQFYWILNGNRVVIESNGAHLNNRYQGIVFNRTIQQQATSRFRLFGRQSVAALPQPLSTLLGTEQAGKFQILSGIAQFVLPRDLSQDPDLQVNFTLNNFDGQGNDFSRIVRIDDIAKGKTSNVDGGGAFFTNLEANNAPQFLQGSSTTNLQSLLHNGVQFRPGAIVPLENLQAIGVTPGEFFSGQGFRFNPNNSSAPGIKTLQLNASDNNDLVKLLSSPFLTARQRDYYYLNSLAWNSGGQEPATIETIELDRNSEDWYRLTLSWSNNRTLLEYHPEKVALNYTNVFANPGVSLTYQDFGHTDNHQTLNASLGLAFGGLFYLLNPNQLNNHLQEARQHYIEAHSMSTLKTQATSQERRAMNFRLNRTLQNVSSNSGLSQVSGSYTFQGNITPQDSLLMQLKSGVHVRGVSFYNQTISDWSEAPITISSIGPSDFGPLTFTGVSIPIDLTSIDYNPTVSLGFMTVQDGNGQIVFDRTVLTTVPFIGGKAADINFGRINFRQTIDRLITTTNYQGYLYLPSLEFALAGTTGDLSYSVTLGSWFNLSPHSAPDIIDNFAPPNSNGSISQEKSLGLYFKTFVKGDFNQIFYDAQNQWETILTHTPSLSLNASSNPNRLNTSSLSLSYTLQLLRRAYNGSVTFSTSYSPQGLNAEFDANSLGKLGLFTALNFYHQSGFRFSGSLSLGDTSFYAVETTYDVIQDPEIGTFGIGPYYANYAYATRGFDALVADATYGVVLNYVLPNSGVGIRAKLGTSEFGFRGQLSINGRLKF